MCLWRFKNLTMPPHPLSHNRRGAALIIVLTMLIVISGIILAFMEYSTWDLRASQSSANRLKAQEITLGGAQAVVSSLLREMHDPAHSHRYVENGVTLYDPISAQTLSPRRSISQAAAEALPSLIKSSRFNVPPWPEGPQSLARASAVSTADPARNGRRMDYAFWNEPRLNPVDAESIFNTHALPDWILVTRGAGARPFAEFNATLKDPLSEDFVIGRYAYTVYDVSGLLDITVAGGPPVGNAGGAQDPDVLNFKSKSTLAFADLSRIPGITDVSAFIEWRNRASREDFAAHVFPTPFRLRDFRVTATGDDNFLGRRDLIRAAERGDLGIREEALPYLTVFSRMKNAPAWRPGLNLAAPYQYEANANEPSSKNRNLPLVRVTEPFERFDGSTATVGEPLLQRRFPFSHFELLTPEATAEEGSDIHRLFGLTRSDAYGPWTYNHGAPNRILTLAEVADRGREPDLAELLQATILEGSLGAGDPGRSPSQLRDDQTHDILTIMANLIDQQDADFHPTLIQFRNSAGNIVQVAGVESLPYFEKLVLAWGRSEQAGASPAIAAYLFPQVARRQLLFSGMEAPVSLVPPVRIRFTGDVGQTLTDDSDGAVVFAQSLVCNDAKPLTQAGVAAMSGVPGVLTTANTSGTGAAYNPGNLSPIPSFSTWVGVRLLDMPHDPALDGTASATLGANAPFNMILEFQDQAGVWRPYTKFSGRIEFDGAGNELHGGGLINAVAELEVAAAQPPPVVGTGDWANGSIAQAWVKPFGTSSHFHPVPGGGGPLRLLPGNPRHVSAFNTIWPTGNLRDGNIMTSPQSPPGVNTRPGSGDFAPADLSFNQTTHSHYADPDGVVRRGDGYKHYLSQYSMIVNPGAAATDDEPAADPNWTVGYLFNRTFRTPGETGATDRGAPFRTLNYWTDDSGDKGLLELFTAHDQEVVAGVINPNTRMREVLESIFRGAAYNYWGFIPNINYAPQPVGAAQEILDHTAVSPFLNRGDLARTPSLPFFGDAVSLFKESNEVPVRALSEVSNLRTWNLLIDIVGQSGRYPPGADALGDFVVTGESRYWLHIAIDRHTGEIVDQLIEQVSH